VKIDVAIGDDMLDRVIEAITRQLTPARSAWQDFVVNLEQAVRIPYRRDRAGRSPDGSRSSTECSNQAYLGLIMEDIVQINARLRFIF
jgi:hypothetical protein